MAAKCGQLLDSRIPYGPSRRPWQDTLSEVAISASDGKLLVSPPTADPLTLDGSSESAVLDVTAASYQVPSSGLSREEHDQAMEETKAVITKGNKSFLGFMSNTGFSYPALFQSPLTNLHANNGGDPFVIGTPLSFKPKWVERNVLDYFASLWNAKWPHNPSDLESYWGYVLTMGATEGNMHALWSARNYLSGKGVQTFVENGHVGPSQAEEAVIGSGSSSTVPVLIYSQNSNYSINKVADIVNLLPFHVIGKKRYPHENPLGGEWVEGVPCTGGSSGPGMVDIDALADVVDFFSGKGHPIVVVFNYGTTLKGACDDVKEAGDRLVKILKKNHMYERVVLDPDDQTVRVTRKGFWFHVDGALAAAYMPFLEMAYKKGMTGVRPASIFDFRLDYVTSIVTSGHKYIGTPWPCGIYITRNGMRLHSARRNPYTGALDSNISHSRNAHSALLLWSFISTNSYDAQVESILQCLKIVMYAIRKFKELEKSIAIDLWIINFLPSLSIMFRRPNQKIIVKYTLTTSCLSIDAHVRPYAQIFIMKHVTTDIVDSFIKDLKAPDAFSLET